MKQRAEYKRREERIQSVGRLGNPILLNFLAEEAAWTFIGKKTGSHLGYQLFSLWECPNMYEYVY